MADEKWQKVRETFDSALRRKPEERRALQTRSLWRIPKSFQHQQHCRIQQRNGNDKYQRRISRRIARFQSA